MKTAGVYREADHRYQHLVVSESPHAVQLYCVNADQLLPTQQSLGSALTRKRYKIGCWFWELPNFPEAWWHAFDLVDEVWAPTRFIADTLAKVSPKPVVHMPVPVSFSVQGSYGRRHFSLPEERFLFLFSYDFHSFSQRKNPQACIAAFKKAFGRAEQGVGLVIKTVYADRHPEAYRELCSLVEGDERITVIDAVMARDEMYGLIDTCDCFLSLHRSEGFGLGLAEAMLLGKPVIGTAWSGNMDFMNADNSCLVDYTLVPVGRDCYPFWEGQVWADPDVDQAAAHMTTVYRDRAFRERIASAARDYLQEHHSPEAIGRRQRARLREIDGRIS
jgi:glycosyltransferase involved in cell wall biosynthesis